MRELRELRGALLSSTWVSGTGRRGGLKQGVEWWDRVKQGIEWWDRVKQGVEWRRGD